MASSSTPVKAWTYTSGGYPSSLTLSTNTPPSSPSPGHLLIRIHACALNPVDIQLMNVPLWSLPYLSSPKTPCADFSGTLLAANPGMPGLAAGDSVFGIMMNPLAGGTLCEVAHLPVSSTTVVKKPDGWTHAQAASLPLVWLTARTCIACVEPYVQDTASKRVVVLGGSSAVGMYTIFLAKARGWKVLTSCSGRNAEFVTDTMGADEVVDYTAASVAERVRAWKPDAIVDCVGGTECLGIARRYVSIVGDKTARATMGGSLLYLFYPRMVLRWLWGRFGWGERYDCIILDQKKEYLEEAMRVLPVEKIMVDSTFAFEDAKMAFERLNTGRARGKVVVEIG
jgi:NADPH:quinone reductase-like Zn-dependent oxidoreductase